VREREIDVVLSTSPPNSVHLIASAIARRTGIPHVADFRDSWLANPHRRYERRSVRLKRAAESRIAQRALRRVAAVSAVTPSIAEEAAALAPPGTTVRVVANGCDFDEFEGLAYARRTSMRIVHAGSFFGQRSPRPFLAAFAALLRVRPELRGRVQAAFLGELRPADREWALGLGLGEALALEGFRPHAEALAAMRAADVLLLLVPRAGGRGLSVVSGKVYEYLAAERPIVALVPPEGDAATLLRDTGSAWIADPDDGAAIGRALEQAVDAWEGDRLGERRLTPAWRERLDRRTRARELAELLQSVRAGRSRA
jgi:glycosyltransferase involved in cell wall biosynthesis